MLSFLIPVVSFSPTDMIVRECHQHHFRSVRYNLLICQLFTRQRWDNAETDKRFREVWDVAKPVKSFKFPHCVDPVKRGPWNFYNDSCCQFKRVNYSVQPRMLTVTIKWSWQLREKKKEKCRGKFRYLGVGDTIESKLSIFNYQQLHLIYSVPEINTMIY